MSDVWQQRTEHHWIWGAAGSMALHGVVAALLFLLPAEARDRILGAVDFQVEKTRPRPLPEELPPVPEKPAEPEPEQIKVARPRNEKPVKTPAIEQPEPPPKPPPKFTMSGQTFADEGTWGLAAEVGDSRFGSLAGDGEYKSGNDDVSSTPATTVAPVAPSKTKKSGFSPAKSSDVKDKPKVLLEQTIPYPPEARKLGIEGKVRMRVDIDEKGKVVDITILEDPGGGLGKAAAKALQSFVFSPALDLQGKPVDYRITYVYVFELE